MNNLLDMWLVCASGSLCRLTCSECHETIGTTECPMNISIPRQDSTDFIKRVTEKIKNYDPREINITENEFINILMDSLD